MIHITFVSNVIPRDLSVTYPRPSRALADSPPLPHPTKPHESPKSPWVRDIIRSITRNALKLSIDLWGGMVGASGPSSSVAKFVIVRFKRNEKTKSFKSESNKENIMSDFNRIEDLANATAYDVNGEKVGSVKDVYVNDTTASRTSSPSTTACSAPASPSFRCAATP